MSAAAEVLADAATPGHGPSAVTGSKVLRGSAWNLLNRALPQVFILALSVIIARFLGPDGMGRQSYIAFVALSVATLCTGGFGSALLRCVAEALGRGDGPSVRDLVGWSYRLQAGAATLSFAIVCLFAATGSRPTAAWLLAAIMCATVVLQATPNGLLSGTQRWRETSMVSLVVGGLAVPAIFVALALGAGVTGVFAVEAGVGLVSVAWLVREGRRALDAVSRESRRSPRLRAHLLRYTWQTSAGVILTLVIWRRSEFFFLNHYASDTQIALYSIAFACVSGLMMVPEAVGAAMSPAFATLFGAGRRDRIGAAYGRALRLTLTISLPVGAIAAAVGPALIVAVYGDAYRGTAPVLRVMLLLFPLIPAMTLSNSVLLGVGRLKVPLIAGFFAAGMTILADVLLIPGHGALGAGMANTIGQVGAATPVIIAGTRASGSVRLAWPVVAKVVVAAAVAAGAALAVLHALGGTGGALVGAAAGGVAFVAVALPLRILTREDADALARALPATGPGAALGRFARRCGG